MGQILDLKVPVPPIEVQKEIVNILDKFTQLEAELSAELEARRAQYEFYRKQLMDLEDNTNTVELSELIEFINAKPHEKLVDPNGDIALMTSKFVATQGKSARHVMSENVLTPAIADDVAMVMSDLPNGRALARAFYVEADNKYAANQRVCLLRTKNKDRVLPKFLYYSVDRNKQLLKYDSGFDQTHLKKDWILNVKVCVPPLGEQKRIVGILDSFEELVNGISHGIPAEQSMRRRQYEYYRNKLLTFQELPA
jgi:type I restriction enzyme S subunit